MPVLPKSSLYTPIGTQVGTANATGTNTTVHTTNADASDINIGDIVKIYTTTSGFHQLRSFAVTISDKQVDTPSAGTTRFTFSPALGTTTASGDLIYAPEVVDVETWISDNMTKTDRVLGAWPCTSTTRPDDFQVSQFSDMLIYERDTQSILRYDGPSGTWETVCSVTRARGRVGYSFSNAAGATTGADDITGPYIPLTFTARRNQWYRIFASFNLEYVAGSFAEAFINIHKNNGGSVSSANTLLARIGSDVNSVSSGVNNRVETVFKHTLADQQITVGLFLSRDGMSDSDTIRFSPNQYNHIGIEDIGQ